MRIPLLIRRLLLGAGLALAIVAPATLGGAGAGAQPESPTFAGPLPRLPEISAIAVRPGGTEATITFATVEPTTATIQYNPVVGGSATNGRRSVSSPSSTTHTVKLTGLTSNTGYDVSVVAETSAGRRLNAHAVFQTLKKRVRLVLDEITITDDGDWFGKGEPTWFWTVQWDGGGSGGCFPNTTPSGIEHLSGVCQAGSYGEGTFVPRNDRGQKLALTFAEENFSTLPKSFFVSAKTTEEDLIDPLIVVVSEIFPEFIPVYGSVPFEVPQGREWISVPITLHPHCNGCSVESRMLFRFDVFHDNLPYPPNHGRALVHSNF